MPRARPTTHAIPSLAGGDAVGLSSFVKAYVKHQALIVRRQSGKQAVQSKRQLQRRQSPSRFGRLGYAALRRIYARHPRTVKETFNLEQGPEALGDPARVLGTFPPRGAWYVSFVVQKDRRALKTLLSAMPAGTPSFLNKQSTVSRGATVTPPEGVLRQSDAAWVFLGNNPEPHPLCGRPEHTDAIGHSGTWHLQLRGSKVWKLRPTKELIRDAPALRGVRQVLVRCNAGDILCLNTRLWWHQTYLPSKCGLSLSVARDIFLDNKNSTACDMTNVVGRYATKRIPKGAVVLTEQDMPDCELPRTKRANCEVGELSDGTMALVAKRTIAQGEWLAISDSEDEAAQSPPKRQRLRG